MKRLLFCNTLITAVLTLLFFSSCVRDDDASAGLSFSEIEKTFVNPPDTIQTSVYWYWISDNISKEGVVKDLQAMKKVGINRAFIGNIGLEETPYGKVKLFSDGWWDILQTALKTATDLNIEIGIFNSPGWSQSGGPWIKPQQAMRYLAFSEVSVTGPKKGASISLLTPAPNFQDVKVIAFRAPKDYSINLAAQKPVISSEPAIANINYVMDGDTVTEIAILPGKPLQIDFKSGADFTARNVMIYPAHREMKFNGELQVKEGSTFKSIKTFTVDRSNDALNTGFNPYGPASVSMPATASKQFRLVFNDASPGSGVVEVKLSSSPKVESYIEKTHGDMFPTPLPYWNEYQWPAQPVISDTSVVVKPEDVLDITKNLGDDGKLNWDVPAGKWIILRTGMTPTKVTNGPASPEGTGLEVDKMSKEHVAAHFDAFLGEILKRIPAADRKTWKVVVEDSYETGGQNWTDELITKFKEAYGYDPLPYMPVIYGIVVGSQDQSDRFLWDLRRFIADRVSYDYVGGLREVSHKHGLTTWLENYGHWGFPGEFLQYGGQSDEIGGEFWSEGELGNIENRAASSAAHIYGKTKVSAESFTAGGKTYVRYPAMMKQRGDRFFTEGINNTLLHVYIQQPSDEKVPGINAGFGNEFNRHNTWFYELDLFIQYLKRTNFMLQQGKYVADVAYFIGEDAPKMTGVRDPELQQGYSFDYINGEVVKERLVVEDGKYILPDGMQYRLLVLPKLETMRPDVLKKIRDMVNDGAYVLGPAPKRSPSLEDYGSADKEVQQIAAELWGKIDGKKIKTNKYGKGMVMNGMTMQEALDRLKVIPDCKFSKGDSTLFIHRKLAEGDVYFVSNQQNAAISINPQFRIAGKSPELWNGITGSIRKLPDFTQSEETTTVPLKLAAYESAFIIFRNDGKPVKSAVNFPEPELITTLTKPWTVTFDPAKRGPAKPVIFQKLTDWTKRPEDSIKHYSGTAAYTNTFNINKIDKDQTLFLDLGSVIAMARVKVNGKPVGGVWTPPWKVDITNVVKAGENKVEIQVVNTWVNRLIGDSKLPPEQRKTSTSINPYKPNSPLEPSGLTGPVTVQAVKYNVE